MLAFYATVYVQIRHDWTPKHIHVCPAAPSNSSLGTYQHSGGPSGRLEQKSTRSWDLGLSGTQIICLDGLSIGSQNIGTGWRMEELGKSGRSNYHLQKNIWIQTSKNHRCSSCERGNSIWQSTAYCETFTCTMLSYKRSLTTHKKQTKNNDSDSLPLVPVGHLTGSL